VLQADGGTRTAAITGAYVALADAIEWGRAKGLVGKNAKVLLDSVAAVSVGIIDGEPMLDLAYVEDVRAETDMNVVVTGRGLFVEVQGTAEGRPSTSANSMLCSNSAWPAAPICDARSRCSRRDRCCELLRGGRRRPPHRAGDPQSAQGGGVRCDRRARAPRPRGDRL
jgi:hypothetical protein